MAPLWLIPLLKIRCLPMLEQHIPLPKPSVYEDLMKWDMIEYTKTSPPPNERDERIPYSLTERGRIYCDAVTNVPYPEKEWRIPRGKFDDNQIF